VVIRITDVIVRAVFAQKLFGFVAGQAKGPFVPISNSPIAIQEVHAIANVL
jgi:hypothetical protein